MAVVYGITWAIMAATSVAAVVIKNGAPCLEGRAVTSREDTTKNDWACFMFCSLPGRDTPLCRACCLDTDQAVDHGGDHGGPGPAPTSPPAEETTVTATTKEEGGEKEKTKAPEEEGKTTEKAEGGEGEKSSAAGEESTTAAAER